MIAITTIERACDLITDGTHYTPRDVGRGVPFLTVKDVTDEALNFLGCSFISEDDYVAAKAGNSAPQRGDVLFSKDGTVGKVHVVDTDRPFAVLSSLAILRPKRDAVDPRYFGHVLRSPSVLDDALRRKTGSAIRRVILSDLKNVRIPLPPLPEQRRIAEILDKADALRAKRRAALAQLDTLTQSIFLDMFGDPAIGPSPGKVARLDSLGEVGSSKRVFVEELVEEGIPFFRGTEVGQLGAGERVNPSLFISPEHYERLKVEAGVPERGDLLLPSICPDGRIYQVDTDEPFYFKDARVLWIKVNSSRINSSYLRQLLKMVFAKSYSKIASGTTFAELKIFALKQLEIPVPPLDQQLQFERIARLVEVHLGRARASHNEFHRLFASLQHRAFRGEL